MATPKDVFAASGLIRGNNSVASRLGIDAEIVNACLRNQRGFSFVINEQEPLLISLTK